MTANVFNEQVSVEIKKKVVATLDKKTTCGVFIGPSSLLVIKNWKDHNYLVPDPIAEITVRKIFDLAAKGAGYRDCLHQLMRANDKEIPPTKSGS